MGKQATISEQLRRAIAAKGESLYAIANGSGVNYAQLHRFVKSERSLTLTSADRLAAYLGLRITK